MHTNNRLQRHWKEAQEFIRHQWPQFTEVELAKVDGDYDRFFQILKDLYGGFPKLEAEARGLFQKFFNAMDAKYPERVRTHL